MEYFRHFLISFRIGPNDQFVIAFIAENIVCPRRIRFEVVKQYVEIFVLVDLQAVLDGFQYTGETLMYSPILCSV